MKFDAQMLHEYDNDAAINKEGEMRPRRQFVVKDRCSCGFYMLSEV